MATAIDPRMKQAKRWARRVARKQSAADKRICVRRTVQALFSILPPKRDGTHPLDADQLKLEGGLMAIYANALRRMIAEVLAVQPLPGAEIAIRIGIPSQRVHVEIGNMLLANELKAVGSAHDAGFVNGYRKNVRAYGLPDAPMLGAVPAQPQMGVVRTPKPTRRSQSKGSGVIAPPPYVTGYRWGLPL